MVTPNRNEGGLPPKELVPLALLVAGVLADDPNDTTPPDHLALVADLLDARAHLHGEPPDSSKNYVTYAGT
jgi:hypothetical protein